MSDFREVLRAARSPAPLDAEHFGRVAAAAADPTSPDYQLAAWLATIYLRGLSTEETFLLTMAMAQSGGPVVPSPGRVDKHSTGGVGDKVTLVVAPLVASLGIPVAKMSGRGLAHTGGTLDKLESIPGFRVHLARREWARLVDRVGLAVAAQSEELAPSDGRLYALRDATAAVDSPALIASSILSKKIAGGAPALVLDVKVGRGSFNASEEAGRHLAQLMLALAQRAGLHAAALLTNMEEPLGHAVGNALEVNEAWAALTGQGPPDLRTVATAVAGAMVEVAEAGQAPITYEAARERVSAAWDAGRGAEKFLEWVAAQGGDARQVERGLPVAESAALAWDGPAGWVARVDPLAIGEAAMQLGAGRRVQADRVNARVGVDIRVKAGDRLAPGCPLGHVYGETAAERERAAAQVRAAVEWSEAPVAGHPMVLDTLWPPD